MRRCVAVGFCTTLTLCAQDAAAFNQTQTCNINGGILACDEDETPKGVRWPTRSVDYLLHEDGSKDYPSSSGQLPEALIDAVTQSFEAWSTLPCTDFELVYTGTTSSRQIGFSRDLGSHNLNVVVWQSQWPRVYSRSAYALTSVTYDTKTGLIADADIEVNDDSWNYSIGPSDPERVDIQNMMTHEVGHFIGLDHNSDSTTAMFPLSNLGEISKRDLAQSDIDGMCTIYPPLEESVDGGCCAHTPHPTLPRRAPLALLLLTTLVVVRRRARRPQGEDTW
ncbi:MAG: matrixin family metalloprotease [Myxococcota bacterium]